MPTPFPRAARAPPLRASPTFSRRWRGAIAASRRPPRRRGAPRVMHNSVDSLLSRPLALVVALALVSLLPFVFMTLTSFVKISTVLQIVRGAIGAQSVPSGTVVMALSAALTLLAMAPVGQKIVDRATPLFVGKETPDTVALVRGGVDAIRSEERRVGKECR